MFNYEKELEKILKIIGEDNYEFHDFNLSMIGKNQIDEITFSIVVNCSLKKIKKKSKEISELTKDKDFAYTIMLFNKSGLDPNKLSGANEKFMVDFDNNLGYTTNRNGKIISMMFTNEIEDLSEEDLILDEKDFSSEPFIPYA